MNTIRHEPADLPLAFVMARAAATWFLDQPTLLRHGTLRAFEKDFRQTLDPLIVGVTKLAEDLSADDVPAKVALAGVGEARRRLGVPEAAGLRAEMERVKQLARSVIALCGHHDALSGVRMCLLCDKPIGKTDPWEPYGQAGLSGSPTEPGRVHSVCDRDARHP